MKHPFFICFVVITSFAYGQNVQVDSQTYTPQQLIEDILINSQCISNVQVTNVVGGNFNGTDQSYGFFDASGSTFPFQSGLVLSTGRLSNVEGPNTSLSDDNADNWGGDIDLETILNENNTINATIIEFNFTAIASQISFRYLFASEEYQENNANTCQFSDLFGFLIRNVNDTQFTNIALVPNTQTPVKVTTVHPNIPNGCSAQNETYFGSWNDLNAPINFNGQTAVLTATANTVPNETYHVKLVIADEQNHRFDSAVFLESGSFQLSTDLGIDRLIATNNPLCENEILQLNAFQPGNNTYKWFKNNVEIFGETNETYMVTDAGIYNVEVTLNNGCIAYGNITIEYSEKLQTTQVFLDTCDNDTDGITFFDLRLADQFFTLNGFPVLPVIDYYLTENEAIQNINPINNPNSFINSVPTQVIFARLENEYGCFAVEPLTIQANYTSSNIKSFVACDDDDDGFTIFDLDDLRNQIKPEVSQNANITFYSTYEDAANNSNPLSNAYLNTTAYSQEIYVKAQEIYCELFTSINLSVNNAPILLPDETIPYCLNSYPQSISINSGLLNAFGNNPTYEWFLNNASILKNTSSIEVNETGTFSVLVSFSNGCSKSRDVIVNPSNIATIENIDIQQASSNNTISITVSGEGDYQYALDTTIFNDNNLFTNVKPGFHTVYVLDTNGCGIVQQEISVLGFPKFFTPNNDGFNDTWKPQGVNAQFNSDIDIKIFDRYGKFIKQINPLEEGWNGTFNGMLLASDDFWYVVMLPDGTQFRDHFTLKR
ncbi:choice-of-anchor L domain-containing protein [Yeosuana sp. AK3]